MDAGIERLYKKTKLVCTVDLANLQREGTMLCGDLPVDFSACIEDPLFFMFITRLVVTAKRISTSSAIPTEKFQINFMNNREETNLMIFDHLQFWSEAFAI